MNTGVTSKTSRINVNPDHMVYLMESSDDEINAGRLLRNRFSEWNAILALMVAGLLPLSRGSCLSMIHFVKDGTRLPPGVKLGDTNNQELLEVSPVRALSQGFYQSTLPVFFSERINNR